jgi:putative inorganic carbon (HCO3(-)) transporter
MIYKGLLLFFVLEYVRPSRYLPILDTLKVTSIVPIGLALAAILTKGRVTNLSVLRDPATKLMFVLLGLLGLSLLTADVTFYAYETLKWVFGYVLIFWVIAKKVDDTNKLLGLFRTIVAVHLALAVLNPKLLTSPEVRSYLVSAPFLGDGNDFSLSVNIAIPFCYGLLVTAAKKRSKALYAVALLVLVACVVATQSRGATIGLACLAVYYWLRTRKKVITALVIAAAVAFVLAFAPSAYFDRMNTINTTESSAKGRIDSWKAAWQVGLRNPVLGVGAGHFSRDVNRLTAHSVYFLALGELGFPGLGVVVLLVFVNLAANRRVITEVRTRGHDTQQAGQELVAALSASVIAFAVTGAFLSALYYPHLYVLAGVSVAGRRIVREKYLVAGDDSAVTAGESSRETIVSLGPETMPFQRHPVVNTTDRTALGEEPSRFPK